MKKFILNPSLPDMYFDKAYQEEYSKKFSNILKYDFISIQNESYVTNGLLRIRSWFCQHIMMDTSNVFVSKQLKEKLLELNFCAESYFSNIAYGWVIDPDTDPIDLPEFFHLDLTQKNKEEHIYIKYDESDRPVLYVSCEFLHIVLSMSDDEWLTYEEVS
ncbi:hypothetical protein WLQ65_16980 [Pseudoalteromonas piscicida]|uniref:hypothetical protein n=1 Tax=Pseudoalteromonas piscicida TaxID=43662 RepID=UPI0030C92F38